MIAEVVINSKALELNTTFDYIVPNYLIETIKVGQRVFVPFGKTLTVGYVTKTKDNTTFDFDKLKEISDIIDDEPLLTNDDIELANLISKHYFTSLGSAFELMIPIGLRQSIIKKLVLKNYESLPTTLKDYFANSKEVLYDSNMKKMHKFIQEAIKNNSLEIKYILKDKGSIKKIDYVKFIKPYVGRGKKAKELSDYLEEIKNDVKKSDLISFNFSLSTIKVLEENGNISIYQKETYRKINGISLKDEKVKLNDEQENVYQTIKEKFNTYSKFLIHGVCGSGKTEIYLNLIEDVLKENKTSLMLVPEISLTPQMAARFKQRFSDSVAILHSRLSINERYDEYRRIKNGLAKVIVGARSAIFAPAKNIGLIILDEEQEESYIQDSSPQYDTHFIAEFKAKKNNCPLVLGSATPKVNTYYKALNGEYKLLYLYKRANNKPLETSEIIDMRQELKSGNRTVFSNRLREEIINNYNRREQSILFINRRGFSKIVMCRNCGETIKCPNCDVALTYHKTSNSLKCHYCGYSIVNPNTCPNCSSKAIKFMQAGTEKVEEEIRKMLPEARIIRMDQDSTRGKNDYDNIISKINNHEVDIIVGTQSVAKGLDFPLVSLVGVVNSDLGLNMPFYDSYERTYDLIEQVSGRAGRKDTLGKCIIQTYNPENISITSAANHSYLAFYNSEIKKRMMAKNPPFSSLIEILISSKNQQLAYSESLKIKKILDKLENAKILGPVTDRIYMLDKEYRYVITVKSFDDSKLDLLNDISESYLSLNNIKIFIKRM